MDSKVAEEVLRKLFTILTIGLASANSYALTVAFHFPPDPLSMLR